jgi:hypothetical protein
VIGRSTDRFAAEAMAKAGLKAFRDGIDIANDTINLLFSRYA